MKYKEMLKACPYNDGEYCNRYEYRGEACDGKCAVGKTINDLLKQGYTIPPVQIAKEIFEKINEALTVEMYKANKHAYNPTEEAKQQGAREALNKFFSVIAELEKEYTERGNGK